MSKPAHRQPARKRRAAILKLVSPKSEPCKDFELSLEEIARVGAKRLLVHALNLEVEEYVQKFKDRIDEDGHRLVVKNGVTKDRKITMGS